MDILEEIDRWVIKHGKDNYEIFDGRNRFENNFKTKMLEQAKLDLGVWNSKRDASIAEQEAIVAMHQAAGGANEQLGRRSQDSTAKRKAVLAVGTTLLRSPALVPDFFSFVSSSTTVGVVVVVGVS